MLPVGLGEPLSRAAAAINNQGFLMPLHTETLTCIVDDVRQVGGLKRNKGMAVWVAQDGFLPPMK